MRFFKIFIMLFILLIAANSVSAHGVDVTADTMVMANDTNGQLAKDIADANGINISVYKFTSSDEVAHILEHSVNNTNKRILVVAYQDIASDFLKNHPDLSKRIIVVNDVNNDTIIQGLNDITAASQSDVQSETGFGMPLIIGIVIGLIVGLGCGVFIMKRKN